MIYSVELKITITKMIDKVKNAMHKLVRNSIKRYKTLKKRKEIMNRRRGVGRKWRGYGHRGCYVLW